MRPPLQLLLLALLACGALAASPDCVNTTAGVRVNWAEGGAPVYAAPCATGQPLGRAAQCAVFEYTGFKSDSTCGENFCYRQVTLDDGVAGWMFDHTLGHHDIQIGPVDSPECLPESPSPPPESPVPPESPAPTGPFSAPIPISSLPYTSQPVLLAQATTAAVADTLTSGLCGLDPAGLAGAPAVVFAYAETRPAGGSLVLSSCIPASTNAAHTLAVLSCQRAVASGDGSDAAGAAGCTCARPDAADCAAEFGSTAKLPTASGGWYYVLIFGTPNTDPESTAQVALTAWDTAPATGPYSQEQVAIRRAAVVAELQAALQDDASTAAYFDDWMVKYGESYATGTPEYASRLATFKSSLGDILRVNTEVATTFWAAPNAFAALTSEEFTASQLGGRPPPNGTLPRIPAAGRRRLLAAPDVVDWEAAGKTTPIRRQHDCGSCWAFAACASLESLYLIRTGEVWDLSEQQLVDCVGPNDNCEGGWPDHAFQYIFSNGVVSEGAYPYQNGAGACDSQRIAAAGSQNTAFMGSQAPGYAWLPSLSTADLLEAVAERPAVIGLAVDNTPSFKFYAGGIYDDPQCPACCVDHIVAVVGYNATGGIGADGTFVKLKNSWGDDWGEGGYMRIAMQGDSDAGICEMYYYMMAPDGVGPPPSMGEGSKRYDSPTYEGIALDWCLEWETQCGQPAASYWCTLQGYTHAQELGGPVRVTEGEVATVLPKSNATCTPAIHQCDTFSYIVCATIV